MGLRRTNIYLDEKQLERLRKKSETDNIPVSELVRRAIDAYLAWDDPTYQPHNPTSPSSRDITPGINPERDTENKMAAYQYVPVASKA